MILIGGEEIEFAESKDIGSRQEFDSHTQEVCAYRWAAMPRGLAARQRRVLRSWNTRRRVAERELTSIALNFAKADKTWRNARQHLSSAESWIDRWSLQAYYAGRDAAAVGDVPMGDSDVEWLSEEWAKAEIKYVQRFFRDITRGMSEQRIKWRAALYAKSLDAVVYHALIASFPPKNTRVRWILGVAEHCNDCIRLSRKRYRPDTLPTTPRAGATRCKSNCRCSLEATFKPAAIHFARKPRRTVSVIMPIDVSGDRFLRGHMPEPDSPIAMFSYNQT